MENEIIKTKICSKCGRELPATTEYFHKKSNGKYGLNQTCKECRKDAHENLKERKKSDNYKQCKICNKTLEKSEFEDNNDFCIKCNDKNIINKEEYKICSKCNRKFPLTREYFNKDKYSNDGWTSECRECRNHKEIFNKIKSKDGYKFCIKCNKELPIDIKYFPPDKDCKGGFRNVCRCCGKDGHYMEDGYIPFKKWNEQENKLFIERYSNYTTKELIQIFYSNENKKSLEDRAYRLGCGGKTEETQERANKNKAGILSEKFKGIPKSEETKQKISKIKKEQYANGILISHWKGRIVSIKERQAISERNKGKWAGSKNPRVNNPLNGELNGRWLGGIKELYYDLRDHLQDWKKSSMENCNYKCVLSGYWFNEIHHLVPFRNIVKEVFEELKLDMRKTIGDYLPEQRDIIYEKLHDIHNKYPLGVCLCKDIHKIFHDEYGYYDTTPKMFEEFKLRYHNGEFDYLLDDKLTSSKAKKRISNN